jgi:hypothetical protein
MTQEIMPVQGTLGEMAFMVGELHALRRLFAIIFAFVFWLTVSFFLAVLYLLQIIRLDQLLSLHQLLSFLSISPFLLASLTWRVSEKLLDKYVKWFLSKYVQIS